MPASTSVTQFLDIPSGVSGNELVQLINDRLRAITQALNAATPMPAVAADFNMNGYRVVVLGNAINPQDALNMQTADKRYATPAALKAAVAAVSTAPASGGQSGSVLLLSVPGTLAIEASATALVIFAAAQNWTSCKLLVKQAPTGGAIAISANAGTKALGTATIAAGAVAASATVSWTLPANTVLSVDLTSVGLDNPGSDLTIELS